MATCLKLISIFVAAAFFLKGNDADILEFLRIYLKRSQKVNGAFV